VRPIADIIWCGVSAPVLQGVFVGLGISVVGLIAFSSGFVLVRPASGKQSGYGRAAAYVKWARRLAWALGVFAGATLIGYVILYSDASGKFCTARFDHKMQVAVLIWTAIAGVTLGLLALTTVLRGLTHRLSK
jgi:hypothetical protein